MLEPSEPPEVVGLRADDSGNLDEGGIARRERNGDRLVADLSSVTSELISTLTALSEDQGKVPSLCPGWTVRDIVVHLAVGDDLARRALLGEDCFPAPTADEDVLAQESRDRVTAYGTGDLKDACAAFATARRELCAVIDGLSEAERAARVAWAARPISRAALVQSRVMETWVHGRDLRHPLGLTSSYDDRCWWVNDLGVRHVSYALAKAGLDVAPPIVLRLTGPGGGEWTRDGAEIVITGPAWAWLIAVTRRGPGRQEALGALSWSAPAGRHVVETARAFA